MNKTTQDRINERKSVENLIEYLSDAGPPGSFAYEKVRLNVLARLVKSLTQSISNLDSSMNANAKSSQLLSKRVFSLNIILTIATVVGAIVAIIALFFNR